MKTTFDGRTPQQENGSYNPRKEHIEDLLKQAREEAEKEFSLSHGYFYGQKQAFIQGAQFIINKLNELKK